MINKSKTVIFLSWTTSLSSERLQVCISIKITNNQNNRGSITLDLDLPPFQFPIKISLLFGRHRYAVHLIVNGVMCVRKYKVKVAGLFYALCFPSSLRTSKWWVGYGAGYKFYVYRIWDVWLWAVFEFWIDFWKKYHQINVTY